MNKPAREHTLLDAAIGAIHREAGLRIDVIDYEVRKDDRRVIDAIVQIHESGARLAVEIKRWAMQANVGAIINRIKLIAEPGQGLLVADYINPNLGERLKAADIQFLDTAGNAYINQQPIYIYIKGNKPRNFIAERKRLKTGRAFQPTGIKVVFAFLRNEKLINAPYREIADQAEVALGTVGWVIHDLTAHGFLLEGLNKNQRKLADFDLLLDQWVEVYPHKLKRKYAMGTFTTSNPDWWKTVYPEEFDGEWGGEIAVAKYTNYLNPRHGLIYMDKTNLADFVQAARLRKFDPQKGEDIQIDFVEPFWKKVNTEENIKHAGLVHPIIAYADLIETGDARNLDAANRLRDDYIR